MKTLIGKPYIANKAIVVLNYQLERGDFVKNMKGVNPNEKRFGLGQNYDKS